MRTASLRFMCLVLLMFNTFYFPSLSWWIMLQAHHEEDWLPSESICGKNLIWIQDEEDGACLGPHGFGECGDVNLWQIWGNEGSYTLEHFIAESNGGDAQCLTKFNNILPFVSSGIGLTKCSKKASVTWDFSFSLGQLSNNAWPKQCLHRHENEATTQTCSHGFTPLVPVLLDNPVCF